MTSTSHYFGPLTTTFTPPASCSSPAAFVDSAGIPFQIYYGGVVDPLYVAGPSPPQRAIPPPTPQPGPTTSAARSSPLAYVPLAPPSSLPASSAPRPTASSATPGSTTTMAVRTIFLRLLLLIELLIYLPCSVCPQTSLNETFFSLLPLYSS